MPIESAAPFLDPDPPPWMARGLAYLLIALFVTACTASVIVRVPEVVSGPFVLVPVRGTDPVRSDREGTVTVVGAAEGELVERGAPLFVLRSRPVGDRAAELHALQAQVTGSGASLENASRQYESQRRADETEVTRLEERMTSLARTIALKQKQLTLSSDIARSFKKGYDLGAISGAEYSRPQLESDRLAEELEGAESELAQARSALGKLRHEMSARESEHRELVQRLETDREQSRIRIAALEKDLELSSGSALSVPAPCTGTVLRMHVSSAGALVQEGETLAELACAGERLEGEMVVPQSGLPFIKQGQHVKLLYDAFPYQRYGVRFGSVRWIGPSSVRRDSLAFRALLDIDTGTVRVRGQRRALMPGMGGRADIVIGRRSLISYAFEPIRQLKESFAEGPER